MAAPLVSTLSLGQAMLGSVNRAQSQLAQLTVEASSGQYADLGLQLGAQSGYELSLRGQTDQLQALTTANNLTVTNMKTASAALDDIRTAAQSAVNTLASVTAGSIGAGTTLQNAGSSALQQLISAGNATSNGQYVFGGENSGVAPLADYFSSTTSAAKSAIDTAFYNAFGFYPNSSSASTISASAMQNFLSSSSFTSLFSGSNWSGASGLWSSASSTDVTTEIAPGETAITSTNANQPGFQQLAQAYAMLTEFGGASLSSAAQQTVITAATTLINQGIASTTTTESTLGTQQTRVTDATTSMSNQLTILQSQLGNLDSVNENQIAVQLNSLQTQLESAYQLTDQLQKMTLAQYLPV